MKVWVSFALVLILHIVVVLSNTCVFMHVLVPLSCMNIREYPAPMTQLDVHDVVPSFYICGACARQTLLKTLQALEDNQWITDLAVNSVLDNLVAGD